MDFWNEKRFEGFAISQCLLLFPFYVSARARRDDTTTIYALFFLFFFFLSPEISGRKNFLLYAGTHLLR